MFFFFFSLETNTTDVFFIRNTDGLSTWDCDDCFLVCNSTLTANIFLNYCRRSIRNWDEFKV